MSRVSRQGAALSIETICSLADALELSPQQILGTGLERKQSAQQSDIDRGIELFARLSAREAKEAINILEAVSRLRSRT